ncbi:alpha/beta hydrolase [Nocardia iowensis]
MPTAVGQIGATLCRPAKPTTTVMVLIPGASIDRSYWDPAGDHAGGDSFRTAMNAAGATTLAIDRLGSGRSSKPPGATLTSQVQATAVGELVSQLRHQHGFARVVLAGASLGSAIATIAAINGAELDALLLTGYSHSVDAAGTARIATTFVRADTDPRFTGQGYDAGYLTTAPGTRASSFLGPGADPALIPIADDTVSTFTAAEMTTGLPTTVGPMTLDIQVPVLIANGELDPLCTRQACVDSAALAAAEAPYFHQNARLQAYVLPRAGHAMNFAENRSDYHEAIVGWMATIAD